MNVFVLSTGRCGSTTFARACSHITNFSSAHESRASCIGDERLAYPRNHIEVDHYLAWFLGKLDRRYGDDVWYVHLHRDPERVAASWAKKRDWIGSLATAYHLGILKMTSASFEEACRDQVATVNANIRHFLKDKSHRLEFSLETASADWGRFWDWIGATGDYDRSLAEWSRRYNAQEPHWKRSLRTVEQRATRAYRALVPR